MNQIMDESPIIAAIVFLREPGESNNSPVIRHSKNMAKKKVMI